MNITSFLKPALLTICVVSTAAIAEAGEWRLNPAACPDLREDRIDRRVTTSRRDLREDIRDMRRVECPASAWTYVPSKGERRVARRAYTGPTVIYAGKRGYYRPHVRHNLRPALINIVID